MLGLSHTSVFVLLVTNKPTRVDPLTAEDSVGIVPFKKIAVFRTFADARLRASSEAALEYQYLPQQAPLQERELARLLCSHQQQAMLTDKAWRYQAAGDAKHVWACNGPVALDYRIIRSAVGAWDEMSA
jgi:hypothetical protein